MTTLLYGLQAALSRKTRSSKLATQAGFAMLAWTLGCLILTPPPAQALVPATAQSVYLTQRPAPATLDATTFVTPWGVAVDASGNVYVADAGNVSKSVNGAVYKETKSGTTYTRTNILPSGTAVKSPVSVAVDASGNVFIADVVAKEIFEEVYANGAYTESVIASGFTAPSSVAVDASENLFVVDSVKHTVSKIAYSGTSYGAATTITSAYKSPWSIALDASGNLYVTDLGTGSGKQNNAAVYKQTLSGGVYSAPVSIGGSGWIDPGQLFVDAAGNVFVSDDRDLNKLYGAGLLDVLIPDTTGTTYTKLPIQYASSNTYYPSAVAYDGKGSLFYTDINTNAVSKIDLLTSPTLVYAQPSTQTSPVSATASQTVILLNTSASDLQISKLEYPTDFIATTTTPQCNVGVLSGNYCQISVAFLPIAVTNPPVTLDEVVQVRTNSVYSSTACTTVVNNVTIPGFCVDGTAYLAATAGVAPTIAPPTGTYSYALTPGTLVPVAVTLTATGENIYYTTDGTQPEPAGANVNVATNATTFNVGTLRGQTVRAVAAASATSAPSSEVDGTYYEVATTELVQSAPTSTFFGSPVSVDVKTLDALLNVNAHDYDAGGITLTYTASTGATVTGPASINTVGGDKTFTLTVNQSDPTVTSATVTVLAKTFDGQFVATSNITVSVRPNLVVTSALDDAGSASNCTTQTTPGTGTDANCSLRDALLSAATTGGASITFDATRFASPTTILINALSTGKGGNGTLVVPNNTTVQGPTVGTVAAKTNLVTLSGNYIQSDAALISVSSNYAVLNNLNFVNSVGVLTAGEAAAIDNEPNSVLQLNATTVANNYTLTGVNANNQTNLINAAILNETGASLAINGSTISGNNGGPAVRNQGALTLTNVTLANNTSPITGAAIYNDGGTAVHLYDTTVAGNKSSYLTGATAGGAIYDTKGVVTISNSVFSGNVTTIAKTASADSDGFVATGIADSLTAFGATVAPLANYGGPTQTEPLLPGSAGICQANSAPDAVFDQRGYARQTIYNGTITCEDAGAVQTNYALAFGTQPATTSYIFATLTSVPSVHVTENGSSATYVSGVTASVSDAQSALASEPTTATVSGGSASFSKLSYNNISTGNTLTASLAVSTLASLSATSNTFATAVAPPTFSYAGYSVPNNPTTVTLTLPVGYTSSNSTIYYYYSTSGSTPSLATIEAGTSVAPGGTYCVGSTVGCIGTVPPATNAKPIHVWAVTVAQVNGSSVASTVKSAYYKQVQVYKPTFAVAVAAGYPNATSGNATEVIAKTVTISSQSTGVAIYYTTDGTTPVVPTTCGAAPSGTTQLYATPVTILQNSTVTAVACDPNGTSDRDANTASSTVNVTVALPAPTFSTKSGSITNVTAVSIADANTNATIYYTTDGSTPTEPATGTTKVYVAGTQISVSGALTIKALASYPAGNVNDSSVASATYNLITATPTITAGYGTGTYYNTVNVPLNDATAGATLYCSTDVTGINNWSVCGTAPSATFAVNQSETLYVYAVADGYQPSKTISATYTLKTGVPTFTYNGKTLNSGTYYAPLTSVTITSRTTAATIQVSTNGGAAVSYANPVTLLVDQTTMLTATVVPPSTQISSNTNPTATVTYTLKMPTPTITTTGSLVSGFYNSNVTANITATNPNSANNLSFTVYYTLDGSVPYASGVASATALQKQLSGASGTLSVNITQKETLKVVSMQTGWTPSATAAAAYNNLKVATPVISNNPGGGGVVIADATTTLASDGTTVLYPTIYYRVTKGNSGAYTTYGGGAITIPTGYHVYAYASLTGFTNSAVTIY